MLGRTGIQAGIVGSRLFHPTSSSKDRAPRSLSCLKSWSNHTKRGELVYEPFLGSGTTLAAAEITERICYGIELDPKYAASRSVRGNRQRPASRHLQLRCNSLSRAGPCVERHAAAGRLQYCKCRILCDPPGAAPQRTFLQGNRRRLTYSGRSYQSDHGAAVLSRRRSNR
jgi:hypothetical protein